MSSGRAKHGRGGFQLRRGSHDTTGEHSNSPDSSSTPATAARLPLFQHGGGSDFVNAQTTFHSTYPQDSNPTINEAFSSQQQNQPQQITLEELLLDPTRATDLPTLDPYPKEGTLWFDRDENGDLPRAISNILRRGYKGPWRSWTKTPPEAREAYFIKFAQTYHWRPSLTEDVRREFDRICINRMKGIMSQVKKTGKCPGFMEKHIWDQLVEYWETEDAQKKSEITRNSRYSNRDGLGPHKHTAGQKTYYRVQKDLEKEFKRSASIGEVFVKTHTRSDGSFVDLKAERINEAYKQSLTDRMSQMGSNTDISDGISQNIVLTQEEKDQLFLETTKPDKRGYQYGLGNLARKYGSSSSKRNAGSSVTDTISDFEQKLAEQNQAMENYKKDMEQRLLLLQQQNSMLLQYMRQKDPTFPDITTMPPDGAGTSTAAPAPTGDPDDPSFDFIAPHGF